MRQRRYRMLEMIRQYAHHRLLESGGVDRMRERHLDYYLDLSLQAEQHLRKITSRAWKQRLDAEMGNLRQALEWSLAGSLEKGLRLAAALQWFWHGSHAPHRRRGLVKPPAGSRPKPGRQQHFGIEPNHRILDRPR